jgi:hypothetical protein
VCGILQYSKSEYLTGDVSLGRELTDRSAWLTRESRLCPDFVGKVLFGRQAKIFNAAGASDTRRPEEPPVLPQKQSEAFIAGMQRLPASVHNRKPTFARFFSVRHFRVFSAISRKADRSFPCWLFDLGLLKAGWGNASAGPVLRPLEIGRQAIRPWGRNDIRRRFGGPWKCGLLFRY